MVVKLWNVFFGRTIEVFKYKKPVKDELWTIVMLLLNMSYWI